MHNDNNLPAKAVQERFGISDRTLDRWLDNPALGFPRPFVINTRRYWREKDLSMWEAAQAGQKS